MKNINGEKGWPLIKDTSCITCTYNELVSILLTHKSVLRGHLSDRRGLIRDLHKYETIDACYKARLHELYGPLGDCRKYWLKEINEINNYRDENKATRLDLIRSITNLKKTIQTGKSLIHDLQNIIHEVCQKYPNHCDLRYKLRHTIYSDGQVKFDALVCKPIQLIQFPLSWEVCEKAKPEPEEFINKRFEPITPKVHVTEK